MNGGRIAFSGGCKADIKYFYNDSIYLYNTLVGLSKCIKVLIRRAKITISTSVKAATSSDHLSSRLEAAPTNQYDGR
jgi:hypothetical protein